MNFRKNQKGLSLIEMMMAVAIFSVAFLMALTIFRNVLEGQRSAISAQNIQESMSYAFEMMSKEIRHAQKVSPANQCNVLFGGAAVNEVYTAMPGSPVNTGDTLLFKNKDKKCVKYYLQNERLIIERCDEVTCANRLVLPITPDEVKVSNLQFIVFDNPASSFLTGEQPKVTFTMDVEMSGGKAIHKQSMKIQTTVSSRYYE